MSLSSPRSLGCPQWAPSQEESHTYPSLFWPLASALGFGRTLSCRHLRRLWQEHSWTGERRLWGLLSFSPTSPPALKQCARLELSLPSSDGDMAWRPASLVARGVPKGKEKLGLGSWSISAQACSRLPAPSSASFLCLSLPSRKQHCGSTHQQTDQGERTDQ